MFETIVWATDGTENASRALAYAKALARQKGAKLIVAHVVERYASHNASGLAVHADEEQVEERLHKLVAQLQTRGLIPTSRSSVTLDRNRPTRSPIWPAARGPT